MPEFYLSFHPLSKLRAQGKPGADCTRGFRATKSTGVGPQVQPESLRLSPRNGLRLPSCSPAIGLFCHRRLRIATRKLDASVEASGPHDFTVRIRAVRQ